MLSIDTKAKVYEQWSIDTKAKMWQLEGSDSGQFPRSLHLEPLTEKPTEWRAMKAHH